jgi:hypothetical protein
MSALVTNIAIGIVVVCFVLYRQLQTRPVRGPRSLRIMVIIGVLGVVQLVSFTEHTSVNATGWTLLVVGLATGAGFGLLRGTQMHVWMIGDNPMRKGNAITLVLWVVGIAIHLLIDVVGTAVASVPSGLGSASLLLYLAVTLGVQQAVVGERANRLQPLGRQQGSLPS